MRHEVTSATNTLHGVFLQLTRPGQLKSSGVIITGPELIGKSDLALELVNNGHRLIADDVIELKKVNQRLIGTCPPLLQDHIAIRDIGLLNLRKIFGKQSICKSHPVDLLIQLSTIKDGHKVSSIEFKLNTSELFGVKISSIDLPYRPQRNNALLIEMIVKNFELMQAGYNTNTLFAKRQLSQMKLSNL